MARSHTPTHLLDRGSLWESDDDDDDDLAHKTRRQSDGGFTANIEERPGHWELNTPWSRITTGGPSSQTHSDPPKEQHSMTSTPDTSYTHNKTPSPELKPDGPAKVTLYLLAAC